MKFKVPVLAILAVLATVPASARGADGGERVLKNGIVVSVESPGAAPKGFAFRADMISDWKAYEGKTEPVDIRGANILAGIRRTPAGDHIPADRSEMSSMNIIGNLDIYIAETDGRNRIIRHGISEFKITVEVYIPRDAMAGLGIRENQILFFFDDKDQIWYPMTDPKSGVSSYYRDEEGGMGFRLADWPVDDKMLCSGP